MKNLLHCFIIVLVVVLCSTAALEIGSASKQGESDDDDQYGAWFQSRVAAKSKNYLDKMGSRQVSEDTDRKGRLEELNLSSNRYYSCFLPVKLWP